MGYYSFISCVFLCLVYIYSRRQLVEADRSILELLNKLMSSHRQPGKENESESTNYNCTYDLTPDLPLSLLCLLLITKGRAQVFHLNRLLE